MDSVNTIRLQKLYKLYEQVCSTILGHPLEDRADLHRLKDKVVQEIREIEGSLDKQLVG